MDNALLLLFPDVLALDTLYGLREGLEKGKISLAFFFFLIFSCYGALAALPLGQALGWALYRFVAGSRPTEAQSLKETCPRSLQVRWKGDWTLVCVSPGAGCFCDTRWPTSLTLAEAQQGPVGWPWLTASRRLAPGLLLLGGGGHL